MDVQERVWKAGFDCKGMKQALPVWYLFSMSTINIELFEEEKRVAAAEAAGVQCVLHLKCASQCGVVRTVWLLLLLLLCLLYGCLLTSDAEDVGAANVPQPRSQEAAKGDMLRLRHHQVQRSTAK